MPKRYVVLDLRSIRSDLGNHYNHTLRDEYTGVCEVCEEDVPQNVNECPVCGTPVVWRGSPLWKALFGSPDAAIRLLNVVEPEEQLGRELCDRAGVAGFANQTEADRWRRAIKKLDKNRVRGIIEWVTKKKRGRGAISHAINFAAKVARETPVQRKKASDTQGPRALDAEYEMPLI